MELKNQKKILEKMQQFEKIEDLVLLSNTDTEIIYVNSAVEEITGFKPEECIGVKTGKLWGGHMDRYFYESMWESIRDLKHPFNAELLNYAKDGMERRVDLTIGPILDKDLNIQYYFAHEPLLYYVGIREENRRDELMKTLAKQHMTPDPLATIDKLYKIIKSYL